MQYVIVSQAHKATYQQVINAVEGEMIEVGPEDVDFPGWVWCTDQHGISSWIPKAYLAIESEKGRLLRDYNAMELTVGLGDRLSVVVEESSWYLCESENGVRGWVPIENVRPL